ncbi:MAG: hypothetical protein ACE5EU_03455 [Paracoccaceae bacterium]
MTIESEIHPVEGERPRLFVETEDGAGAADGMVVPAGARIAEDAVRNGEVIRRCQGPDRPPGPATIWVADGGLDRAVALRDCGEGIGVVPRVAVRRGLSRYSFRPANPGEGFSTYCLDPGSVAVFLVCDGGQAIALADWLDRASALGFDTVWLHGIEAAEARRGFPIEMLRKAHGLAPELAIWLSGGGCELRHFERLAPETGLAAVVVPETDLARLEAEAVRAALTAFQPAVETAAT